MAGDVASVNRLNAMAAPQPQFNMAMEQQLLQAQQQHVPVVGSPSSTVIQQQQMASGVAQDPASMQQAQPYQATGGSDSDSSLAVHANAMQQQEISSAVVGDASLSVAGAAASSALQQPQVQQQAAPVRQAVYYYDPKQTVTAQNGQVLQLPSVVYDQQGKAIPLAELRQSSLSTPIYVQPPAMGSAQQLEMSQPSMGVSSTSSGNDAVDQKVLLESATGDLQMEAPSARGAVRSSSVATSSSSALSRLRPKAWGESTSQDQTIIVATVAVMALLVGALSARRLRTKSFLASCIENEALEDDLAYDSAYTTAGGSLGGSTAGGAGGESSYNTFGGGWKGDLEKFDV
jgi:hypothetical protein